MLTQYRCICESNINISLKEIRQKDTDWNLAQDRGHLVGSCEQSNETPSSMKCGIFVA